MKGQGRKPALDEAKKSQICALLTLGCSRRVAAKQVGCAAITIRRTAVRDHDFGERIRQAESRQEVLHLENIQAAAKETKYWRASAWVLERRQPKRYGRRQSKHVTTEQMSKFMTQIGAMIAREVPSAAIRKRIMARLGEIEARLKQPANEETA